MSDLYVEHLVPRKTSGAQIAMKYGLIVATVLAGIAALLTMKIVAFVVFIALGVLDYFKLSSFDLEYEYLYVNGELDVDKIMSKQKRKRVGSYAIENMEILAPYNSHDLDSYKQNSNIKVVDYSSNTNSPDMYAMVLSDEGKRQMLLIEPNEAMLNDIRRMAPSKVRKF